MITGGKVVATLVAPLQPLGHNVKHMAGGSVSMMVFAFAAAAAAVSPAVLMVECVGGAAVVSPEASIDADVCTGEGAAALDDMLICWLTICWQTARKRTSIQRLPWSCYLMNTNSYTEGYVLSLSHSRPMCNWFGAEKNCRKETTATMLHGMWALWISHNDKTPWKGIPITFTVHQLGMRYSRRVA